MALFRTTFKVSALLILIIIMLLILCWSYVDPTGVEINPVSSEAAPAQWSSEIEDLVEECMGATHISSVIQSPSLLQQAKSNAKHLYQEYRKVIPESSLDGYRSHCWKESFSTRWSKSQFSGHIGNISFSGKTEEIFHSKIISYFTERHTFSSSLVCLPKVFLTGFPKCGSTFAYCLINKFISNSLHMQNLPSLIKEPHFWVNTSAFKSYYKPLAEDLAMYFYYFLPVFQHISDSSKRGTVLVDGTSNKMFKWPRFSKNENNFSNYCLLPSVLPKLLPDSKFIVVMRNPVGMLYSTFWYSCTRLGKVPKTTQLKGRDLFHNRIVVKINLFNNCMRDGSVAAISHVCELSNYSSCILQRTHLLDKCTYEIASDMFTPEMPQCGRTRITMGLYFVHIHKWLSIVPRSRFLFTTLEELIQDSSRKAQDILEFLDLGSDTIPDKGSLKEASKSCSTNSQKLVDYKHDPKLKMRNDTKVLLELFYEPFNALLSDLLGKKLPWI